MDPVADMLAKIKNASLVQHEYVDVPFSKMKYAIAKILKDEGYIKNFKTFLDEGKKKYLKIYMKYDDEGRSVISHLIKISRPGRRIYIKAKDIRKVKRNPFGLMILSTSKGILSDKEALKQNLGGEAILVLW